MKWFKHDTDGNRSDKMAFIFDEFGLEGYARWIIMLEEVGAEMDETDNTSLTLPVTEWCKRLRSRREPLEKLLRRLEEVMKKSDFSATFQERSLTISIPNLLKKRDDTSRKVRNSSGKSHSQSKSKDKEEDKNTPPLPPVRVSPEIKSWNKHVDGTWRMVNESDVVLVQNLEMSLAQARNDPQFNIPKIIQRARDSDLLTGKGKEWFRMAWLFEVNAKTGNKNWKDILNGRYDGKGRGGRGSRKNKAGADHSPSGCRDDGVPDDWKPSEASGE